MLRQKGNLNQMNAQRDRGIRAKSRSLPPDRQFDSYLVTLYSLMLMVVLVVGATGYAGIHGLLASTTTAAKAARVKVEQLNREARPDRIVTPPVIALALIAALFVDVADRTSNPRRYQLIQREP
jgi:hypothetical protein